MVQVGNWLEATDIDNALQYYKSAYALDSSCGIAPWHVGQILRKSRRLEEAIEWYQKSFIADPNHNAVAYLLAACYHAIDNFENCLVYIDRCLALTPDHDTSGRLLQKCLNDLCQAEDIEQIRRSYRQISPTLKNRCPALVKELEARLEFD